MAETSQSSDGYERILVISFLLFLKSMQLYAELGNRAVKTPKIIKQPNVQESLHNILLTIETCGNGLERLPTPPAGTDQVDVQFRALGNEIVILGRLLRELSDEPDDVDRNAILNQIQDQSLKIKQDFRGVIAAYEEAYPGRLSRALQAVQP